jgi:hypothetical protein
MKRSLRYACRAAVGFCLYVHSGPIPTGHLETGTCVGQAGLARARSIGREGATPVQAY